MATKISTGLQTAMLVTDSLRGILNGKVMMVYEGTEPAGADDSVGSATLLCTFTESDDGVTGLTYEATPVDGALVKTAAEAWQGTAVATGTAQWYRICDIADAGDASTTAVRIQAAFGGANGVLSNPNFISGAVQTMDYCSIVLPQYA